MPVSRESGPCLPIAWRNPDAPPRPYEVHARPSRPARTGLVCALAFSDLWPGAGTAGELPWGTVATPQWIANLNPFQLLYGVPGSLGARVMTLGSSKVIASTDIGSCPDYHGLTEHLRIGGERLTARTRYCSSNCGTSSSVPNVRLGGSCSLPTTTSFKGATSPGTVWRAIRSSNW